MTNQAKISNVVEEYRESFGRGAIPSYLLVHFLTLELCGEAGELANLVKKSWRIDAAPSSESIAMELADVAILCNCLADALGLQLDDLIEIKLIALQNRIKVKEQSQ